MEGLTETYRPITGPCRTTNAASWRSLHPPKRLAPAMWQAVSGAAWDVLPKAIGQFPSILHGSKTCPACRCGPLRTAG